MPHGWTAQKELPVIINLSHFKYHLFYLCWFALLSNNNRLQIDIDIMGAFTYYICSFNLKLLSHPLVNICHAIHAHPHPHPRSILNN